MAYIGHRCGCGHTAIHHRTDKAGRAKCAAHAGTSCGRGCRMSKRSELLPTFNLKGRAIEQIVAPGGRLATASGEGGMQTCACDNCQALHAELVDAQ
jgi:hypothetical protein